MRTTFSVKYYCRPSKVNKEGQAPIELSIIINGDRVVINLPRKEIPATFNQLINQKRNNDLKDFLNAITRKVYQLQTDFLINNIAFTPTNIRTYWKTGFQIYTTNTLFTEFLAHVANTGVAAKTIRKYQLTIQLWQSQFKDMPVEQVTNIMCREFYSHLQKKYVQSTVAGMATKVKTIFQFGINSGKIKANPMNGIKINKGQKEAEFLTQEEITTIQNKVITIDRISKVRDLFLFLCATGLSFCELSKPISIMEENGVHYIKGNRTKTKQEYLTVVLPFGVEIWNRYNGQLPIISNQKFNSYLKEIGDITGITKNLHVHMARHSFACLLLNKGARIEVVSKALGHSNIRMTQHYSKLIDKQIITEFKNII